MTFGHRVEGDESSKSLRRNNVYGRMIAKMGTNTPIPTVTFFSSPFHTDSKLSHVTFLDEWNNIKYDPTI